MNAFMERLKIVPQVAWGVGILLSAFLALGLVLGPMSFDREMRWWPMAAKIAIASAPGLIIVAYSALVGFVYADAKRRRMRHVMWTWLCLVPYFIGVILYFILRDSLPTPCPTCRTDVPRAFAYCPGCGAAVNPICGHCGKTLQREWLNCPHCGIRIAPSNVAG